jgi:hypothetical protein
MQLVKGFGVINRFIRNTPGVTSIIGELSTWSMTYSKEKGEYENVDIPGYSLITFKSIDSANGNNIALSSVNTTSIISLIKSIVDYCSANIRPYNVTDFRQSVIAENSTFISSFSFGDFADNGTVALPDWIEFTNSANTINCKIWLSDEAFKAQYDEYSIKVIPPLTNLNAFFGSYTNAVNAINNRSPSTLSNLIQTAKGNNPETYLRLLEFDFVNALDNTVKSSSTWSIIIYGIAGDNIDAIKDAIITYLLNNSTHTEEEWSVIFPDIFARTEFILVPRWDLIAIPNLTDLSSLYSSIVGLNASLNFIINFIDFYSDPYVRVNSSAMFHIYKSIAIIVVNGLQNSLDKKNIKDVFPDYIPIPNTSIDFNRMQLKTQQWSVAIEEMLIIAEDPDFYSRLTNKYRIVTRNNKTFISLYIDDIHYLVATKSNF